MLKSLDILIGLSVVMLIVSMAVTLLNQLILNLLASRSRNLKAGLADLLEVLDMGMSRAHAEAVAGKTLSHPLIGGKFQPWLPRWLKSLLQVYKFGDVIHREDFINLLLYLGASYQNLSKAMEKLADMLPTASAANHDEITGLLTALHRELLKCPVIRDDKRVSSLGKLIAAEQGKPELSPKIIACFNQIKASMAPYRSLVEVLDNNGIKNIESTVRSVQVLALQFEKSNPELAHDVRQANALLHEASSEFLAKINQNFDQVMDRVSARFTGTTRTVSVISAVIVAVALQLDTVYVINRLAVDDALRASLVQTAKNIDEDEADDYGAVLTKYQQAEQAKQQRDLAEQAWKQAVEAKAEDVEAKRQAFEAANNAARDKEKQAEKANVEVVMDAYLTNSGIVNFPKSFKEWCDNWHRASIPGIMISILLLSLGAPFWYKALGRLLQLRSLLAQKDDEQKGVRQSNQTSGAAAPGGASQINPLQGEKGDLNAVG